MAKRKALDFISLRDIEVKEVYGNEYTDKVVPGIKKRLLQLIPLLIIGYAMVSWILSLRNGTTLNTYIRGITTFSYIVSTPVTLVGLPLLLLSMFKVKSRLLIFSPFIIIVVTLAVNFGIVWFLFLLEAYLP